VEATENMTLSLIAFAGNVSHQLRNRGSLFDDLMHGLEILEESVHGLFNIGCKVDMNKIVDIIKKLCIQVQSIKSTGNGSGNDKLFNWFVKNPIGDAKMKQYAIKLKHKNSMLMSGIEVENYPKLQIVDKMVILKHIDFIEGCNYL
jgi:hypothetical protein